MRRWRVGAVGLTVITVMVGMLSPGGAPPVLAAATPQTLAPAQALTVTGASRLGYVTAMSADGLSLAASGVNSSSSGVNSSSKDVVFFFSRAQESGSFGGAQELQAPTGASFFPTTFLYNPIAINGGWALIAGAGTVYVAHEQGGTWDLTGQELDIPDACQSTNVSVALSASGAVAVVGVLDQWPDGCTASNTYSGAAFVYLLDTTTDSYGTPIPLPGPTSGAEYGNSVAVSADGTVVAVGNDSAGRTLVYTSSGWSAPATAGHAAQLVALSADGSTLALGSESDGTLDVASGTGFGTLTPVPSPGDTSQFPAQLGLSADGSLLLATDRAYVNPAWVYGRQTDGSWAQAWILADPNNLDPNHHVLVDFGHGGALSRDGTSAAIGADGANDGAGAVYVYAIGTPVDVGPSAQSIMFAPLPDRTLAQSPFTVQASASSGLPVSFSVPDTTGVCTSSGPNGATITLLAAGSCTVQADQPGNESFDAAPPVSRTFTVTPAVVVPPPPVLPPPVVQPTLISVAKRVATAADGPFADAVTVPVGSTVWYRITVANGASQSLVGLVVSDSVASSGLPATCPALPSPFPAGGSYTCTYSHAVGAGVATNTVTATFGATTVTAAATVTGVPPAGGASTPAGLNLAKLNLPAQPPMAYTKSTRVAHLGQYMTWRASLGSAAAGQNVGVYMVAKGADGSWGPWSEVTTRAADSSGVVTYWLRETSASWVSVRFSLDGTHFTNAVQARWR